MNGPAASPSPQAPNQTLWFYEAGGQQAGPVSELDIARMLGTRMLTAANLAWCDGMSNWQPIGATSLAAHVPSSAAASGQPWNGLAQVRVDDRLAWVLAFAPVIGSIIGVIVEAGGAPRGVSRFTTLALNLALVYADQSRLKRAGVAVSGLGPAFLVPFYLFGRARMMGRAPGYAIVWIVAFFASFLMP